MATLPLCFLSQWSLRTDELNVFTIYYELTTSSACSGLDSSPFPSPKPWPSYHKTVTFFGHKSPQLLLVQWLKWDFSFYVNLFNNSTTVVRRDTTDDKSEPLAPFTQTLVLAFPRSLSFLVLFEIVDNESISTETQVLFSGAESLNS